MILLAAEYGILRTTLLDISSDNQSTCFFFYCWLCCGWLTFPCFPFLFRLSVIEEQKGFTWFTFLLQIICITEKLKV